MSNKITEEQYQKIVEAWNSVSGYVNKTKAVIDHLIDVPNVGVVLMGDVAIALANPITREWAHDQFVEKEKKYVWTSKKRNKYGNSHRLYRNTAQSIGFTSVKKSQETVQDEYLTESEIREWGYNPEMFDKEEVV